MGKKKKGKVSKASTGVDPQPASDSQGHAVTTAIVTGGVLVAVVVAVVGTVHWQKKAAASPDRQQRTDSPRAEALSVDEMWEASTEVEKPVGGQYVDIAKEGSAST